jgi:hypothetical protein
MYSIIAEQTDGIWMSFLKPEVMVFLLPIVAVLVGGVLGITKLTMRHRERLAMIERGMHPDSTQETDQRTR